MDELDEEANESHDGEADGGGESDLLKLFEKNPKLLLETRKKPKNRHQFCASYLYDLAWCIF